MARFNEIQVGRYNAILHKLLDMKEGAPAPQLSADVVPALVLEQERPEWAFLSGEKLMSGYTSQAASAGNVCNVQLWNPGGSGVLCVVEQIIYGNRWLNDYWLSWSTVALTTNSVAASRDTRNGIGAITGASQCRYQFAAAPLGTGAIHKIQGTDAPGAPIYVKAGWVISPGYGLIASGGVQNTALSVCFHYRERVIEPSELR